VVNERERIPHYTLFFTPIFSPKTSASPLKMNDDQFSALANYLSDIHAELNRIANALESIDEKNVKTYEQNKS
jgi:hypothetical protein